MRTMFIALAGTLGLAACQSPADYTGTLGSCDGLRGGAKARCLQQARAQAPGFDRSAALGNVGGPGSGPGTTGPGATGPGSPGTGPGGPGAPGGAPGGIGAGVGAGAGLGGVGAGVGTSN